MSHLDTGFDLAVKSCMNIVSVGLSARHEKHSNAQCNDASGPPMQSMAILVFSSKSSLKFEKSGQCGM